VMLHVNGVYLYAILPRSNSEIMASTSPSSQLCKVMGLSEAATYIDGNEEF
jgi:hypothetical protein